MPTRVFSFGDDDSWPPLYERELTALLTRELGAQEVLVFDHTVRVDDPSAVRQRLSALRASELIGRLGRTLDETLLINGPAGRT